MRRIVPYLLAAMLCTVLAVPAQEVRAQGVSAQEPAAQEVSAQGVSAQEPAAQEVSAQGGATQKAAAPKGNSLMVKRIPSGNSHKNNGKIEGYGLKNVSQETGNNLNAASSKSVNSLSGVVELEGDNLGAVREADRSNLQNDSEFGEYAATSDRRHWIYFSDRGMDADARVARMMRDGRLPADAGTDDLPPSPEYVAAVQDAGARVAAESRWLNAVSVDAPYSVLKRVSLLPFVLRIEPVRRWEPLRPLPAPLASQPGRLTSYGLDYGFSLEQLEVMRVPKVHDIWIDGTGITVGVLDNGFRWRPHEAMRGIDVRGEYDFINDDTLTENEEGDLYGQDSHGTVTFSALAGFEQGQLIGPAFNAAFYLAKTEVNGSETQVEEDYWVEGIEWLQANGARVVSASLGYEDWDDGTGYSYDDGDFDGRTAVTTRAAVEAMRRGVLLVTAMGNEGAMPGSLIAPADADSILSVGATDFTGRVASFSSRGPTNDGRTKPDVVAPGVSVYSASKLGEDTYDRSNGTSMATPLAAGVAALVRSARPELTPVQVRDALRATADNADSPDNTRGWGLIDAWDALLYNGMVISTNPKILWTGQGTTVFAYVISPSPVQSNQVTLHWETGGPVVEAMTLVAPYAGAGDGSGLYMASIPASAAPEGTEVRYFISAADVSESRTSPYGAPAARHTFTAGESHLLGAEHLLPQRLVLHQNYPNPFAPSESGATMIRYDVPLPGAQVRLEVFDALGRRVATLVDDFRGPGTYTVPFDKTALSSGVYFYALSAGETQVIRRMLILQ